MANKKVRDQEIAAANKHKADMAKRSIKYWPIFVIASLILLVPFYFVNWIQIYNTTIDTKIEIGATGWDCLVSLFTGNFTEASAKLAPFYYWVHDFGKLDYINTLALFSFISVVILFIMLVFEIVIYITDNHQLSVVSIALGALLTASYVIAFATALSTSDVMIINYCSNNPACSVQSLAIISVVFAAGATALSVVHFIKAQQVANLK